MRKSLALVVLSLCCLASAAGAATLAGVSVPDKTEANGQSLALNGLGLRTKFFIKVYVGALYLPAHRAAATEILAADEPRGMELHFLYSVSKDQLCDAWREALNDNAPNASAEVKKNFETLCSWMDAVPKGQTLRLTYTPGQGTSVEVNGQAKGVLPGKPTSDAILSTWIGPKPGPGDDFKTGVLGGKS
jgi:hypothetical protein